MGQWIAKTHGLREDAERAVPLLAPSLHPVVLDHGLELTSEIKDVEHDNGEFAEVFKYTVDALIERTNGVLKLAHGFGFRGLSECDVRSIRPTGEDFKFHFIERRIATAPWERYAQWFEREHGTPPLRPRAIDDVASLDLSKAAGLARHYTHVARGLRLLELAFASDEGLDWSAAYAAFEVVEEHAHVVGLDGGAVGWWTPSEREAFAATANNPVVLGEKARHARMITRRGKDIAPPRVSMDEQQAGWFLRGVYARWLATVDPPPEDT